MNQLPLRSLWLGTTVLVVIVLAGCAERIAAVQHEPLSAEEQATLEADIAARVAEAETALQTAEHKRDGAVVVFFRTPQTNPERVDVRLQSMTGRGYVPIIAAPAIPAIGYRQAGLTMLRIRAPSYHEFTRPLDLREGQVVVCDDIVLDPVTDKTASTVTGTVRLENSKNGRAQVSIFRQNPIDTDNAGHYRLERVGTGQLTLLAYSPGYVAEFKYVDVPTPGRYEFDFHLYRKRYALLRWAYQPQPTIRLIGQLLHGTAIVDDEHLDRISLAKGFQQVNGRSDFCVRQIEDKLFMEHFDASPTSNQPASLPCSGRTFDEVTEAPQAIYNRLRKPLQVGDVYALRCHDGEHYAKLEVIDVFLEGEPPQTQSEPATLSCMLPEPADAADIGISFAVIDLEADETYRPLADTISDMCRAAIQQTPHLLLVDRKSMVHVLGEEDFAASMQCDNTRCLVNYGRKLRAQKLMHGNVRRVGEQWVVTLKIVDVSSAEVDAFKTSRFDGDDDALLESVDSMTCELLYQAMVAPPPQP